jgi:hypothetical protein
VGLSMAERRTITKALRTRYAKATKKRKTLMLDELEALGELYGYLRLFVNYFSPQMKLIAKTRRGSKVSKTFDRARTPTVASLSPSMSPTMQSGPFRPSTQSSIPRSFVARSAGARTGCSSSPRRRHRGRR